MIYALLFEGGPIFALVEHTDANMNIDVLEMKFQGHIDAETGTVKKRLELHEDFKKRRHEVALKMIATPKESTKECFVQWLIEKYNFKVVDFKVCEVM